MPAAVHLSRLALLLFLVIQSIPLADGRVFLGVSKLLKNDRDYDLLGRFCYVIPPGERGVLHSNVVITEPGHRLVLTRTRDSDEIQAQHLRDFSRHGDASKHISHSMMQKQLKAVLDYQKLLNSGRHRRLLSSLEFDSLLKEAADESSSSSSSSQDDYPPSLLQSSEEENEGNESAAGKTIILRDAELKHSTHIATALTTTNAAAAAGVGVVHKERPSHDEAAEVTQQPVHEEGAAAAKGVGRPSSRHDAGLAAHEQDRAPAGAPRFHHAAAAAAPPPPVVVRADADAGAPLRSVESVCEALEARSRVAENLMPVADRSVYNLVLWVQSHVSGEPVDLWLTRCNGVPHGEYHIAAMNPGSFWVRHFGCEEQGVLQTSLLGAVLYLAGLPFLSALFRGSNRREHPVVDCYFVGCGAAAAHALFHALHVVAFAFDGLGVRAFAFLGDLCHAASIVCVTFVTIRLVLGKRLGPRRGREDVGAKKPWLVASTASDDWRATLAAAAVSVQRFVSWSARRFLLSWNALWAALSGSAAIALWLQGVRGLNSPTALIVADYEFLHPSIGRGFWHHILAIAVQVHWVLRLILAFLCLRALLVRRLEGGRGVAAATAVVWAGLIPLNCLMFPHYHLLYQFAVPLLVTFSNVALLAGLGTLIACNPKYCQAGYDCRLPAALFGKAVAAERNNNWEEISPEEAEAEPQLIDLTRLPQPTHGFLNMK